MKKRKSCLSRFLRRRPALVLILVLSVLALLTVIGTVFVSLAWLDHTTTKSYVDVARAKMLAKSGIEMAIVHLIVFESSQQQGLSITTYGLEFDDVNQNGRYDPASEQAIAIDYSTPLEQARYPSFKGQGNFINLDSAEILTRDLDKDGYADMVGYSGFLPATYKDGRDIYSLQIRDCASMICVNVPSVSKSDWSLAPNTKRMLNNLGTQLKVAKLGEILSVKRASLQRNFFCKEEIKSTLMENGFSDADFNKVRDYITCYAWVNDKTLLPGAIRSISDNNDNPNYRLSSIYPHTNEPRFVGVGVFGIKFGLFAGKSSPVFASCSSDIVYTNKLGYASVPTTDPNQPAKPSPAIKPVLQSRAPININGASAEVLIAVLEGIKGYYLDRSLKTVTAPGALKLGTKISYDQAKFIADAIINRRIIAPFSSFSDFNDFIDSLSITDYEKQLVKANANPNSHLTNFNPNAIYGSRFGDMDKSCLGLWMPDDGSADDDCGWSTEFCFSSMGYYEINSLGRVFSPPNEYGVRKIMAQRKVSALVKIYDIVQHTTQKDFEKYVTDNYTPASIGFTTFPESITDLKTSSLWTEIKNDCLDHKNENTCNHQLCYDGYLTLKPLDGYCNTNPVFAADFSDTLSAKSSQGDGQAYGPADEDRSVIDSIDQSELFPDGVFSHETRRPKYSPSQPKYGFDSANPVEEYVRYKAQGNFQVPGSLEFWFKPAWHPADIMSDGWDTRVLFSMGWGEDKDNSGSTTTDQRIVIFVRNEGGGAFLGLLYCASMQGPASGYLCSIKPTRGSRTYGIAKYPIPAAGNNKWTAGQWHHIAASYNRSTSRLFVDGNEVLGSPAGPTSSVSFPLGILPAWDMYLGSNRFENNTCNFYPLNGDGTFDAFHIYSTEIYQPFLAPDRYDPAGDKIYTGCFPPDDFPAIADSGRIGRAFWTAYIPPKHNLEFKVIADNNSVSIPPESASLGFSNVNLAISPETTLKYEIKFITASSSNGCVAETTILDDIMFTVITKPKFISYLME